MTAAATRAIARRLAAAGAMALAALAVPAGCTSQGIQVDAVTNSVSFAPDPSPRDALRSKPPQVAILPALAPLQPGLAPLTSMAAARALDAALPGHSVIPASVVAGRINVAGLGEAWHDLAVRYSTGGILDREHLAKVGAAAGVRWVLMPMLGNLSTSSNSRFTFLGLVVDRTVSTTVDVSLQAWDVRTGEIAWASTGSCTIEAEVVLNTRASLARALETVFRQMATDLAENRSRSVERATVATAEDSAADPGNPQSGVTAGRSTAPAAQPAPTDGPGADASTPYKASP